MQALAIQPTLDALHYHYDIEKDAIVEKMLSLINKWIEGKEDIESFFQRHIEDIFVFRLYAINFVIKKKLLHEVNEYMNQPFANLKELRYDILAENVNFALKICEKASKKIIPLDDTGLLEIQYIESIEIISLTTFLGIDPNIKDILFPSLRTEFGLMIATTLAFERKNILISEEKINSLSIFVRDSAQSFGGMVRTLSPLKSREKVISTEEHEHPEDMLLAEQGIEEFAHELDNT